MQMARIQEAVDECSLKAATEVLMALTLTEEAEDRADDAPAAPCDAAGVVVERVIGLLTRFVKMKKRAEALSASSESKRLGDWQALAQKWFVLLLDALTRSRSSERRGADADVDQHMAEGSILSQV